MALASGITSVPNAAIVLALPTIHRHFNDGGFRWNLEETEDRPARWGLEPGM